MPGVSGDNTRRRRVQKNLAVEFSGYNGTCAGVSENFSINGLAVRTDTIPALQSVVSIVLHLPDGSISKLKGRVKRIYMGSDDIPAASGKSPKGGMGIEIMERDSNYIRFFMSLLSSIKL